MAKKKTPIPKVEAKAFVKAELVAKATYQRKHSTTEVIPADVTRAKAGAWLDIISPITEWAGLKGDALRYQRQQLRIQQEAALDRLAKSVSEKMRSKRVKTPLPPKILVPALEAASLEDPKSPIIDWWANLLVSGATGTAVRPYLVSLMSAIGPSEAKLLSKIWKGISASSEYSSEDFDLKLNAAFRARISLDQELSKLTQIGAEPRDFHDACMMMFTKLAEGSDQRGFPAVFTIYDKPRPENDGHNLAYSIYSKLFSDPVSIEVCQALKLLEEYLVKIEPAFDAVGMVVPDTFERVVGLQVVAPTELGLEFLRACNPLVSSDHDQPKPVGKRRR